MKQIATFLYKLVGAIIAAWLFGALGMVVGLFLVGGADSTIEQIGITISKDTLIVLAIASLASAIGGAIGFRWPSSMSGANSASI